MLLKKIDSVKNGSLAITLVLEDRCGNSAVIAEKAHKKGYTPD
jgi:C4-type Zn-finger protein